MHPKPAMPWRLARALALPLSLPLLWACDGPSARTRQATLALPSIPVNAVVGDLGGAPVVIPREHARRVEYEDDPPWPGAPGDGPAAVRDYESKLASFSLVAHYPDMQPLTKRTAESYRQVRRRDAEWIDVSVVAGSKLRLSKDESFKYPYETKVPGSEWHRFYDYERLPMLHGLSPFKATRERGLDLVLDDENRDHNLYNHTLYFAYEGSRIVAFIRCRSGLSLEPGGTNTCRHHFMLWPEMKAEAQLSYSEDLLPRWRDYQDHYRDLLLGFRVGPAFDEGSFSRP